MTTRGADTGSAPPRVTIPGERSGWVTFAATMLLIGGTLNIIYGIAAIADSSFFIDNQKYILSNLHTWGWITLVLGLFQAFAALSLYGGGLYGRIFAVIAASLSAIGALLSIPAYPFWSLAIFAIDIIIIHQVCTRGTEGRRV
jgi:hypothetical protein